MQEMTQRGYQMEYSRDNEEMHSIEGRQRKARTMLCVLREAIGSRLEHATALNLGCSTGIIDETLAPHVSAMMGVDIDLPAIELARAKRTAINLEFAVEDAMQLSFADARFDVVICSQVYEHVPDPHRMMSEIHRVLKPGGLCYFAATNRWSVMEKHYHLPFLSWLPPKLADTYVRSLGRGDAYYERHLGPGPLRALVRQFRLEDWTGRILDSPGDYEAEYLFPGRLSRTVARAVYRIAPVMFPGFIWVLWKTPEA